MQQQREESMSLREDNAEETTVHNMNREYIGKLEQAIYESSMKTILKSSLYPVGMRFRDPKMEAKVSACVIQFLGGTQI